MTGLWLDVTSLITPVFPSSSATLQSISATCLGCAVSLSIRMLWEAVDLTFHGMSKSSKQGYRPLLVTDLVLVIITCFWNAPRTYSYAALTRLPWAVVHCKQSAPWTALASEPFPFPLVTLKVCFSNTGVHTANSRLFFPLAHSGEQCSQHL